MITPLNWIHCLPAFVIRCQQFRYLRLDRIGLHRLGVGPHNADWDAISDALTLPWVKQF